MRGQNLYKKLFTKSNIDRRSIFQLKSCNLFIAANELYI